MFRARLKPSEQDTLERRIEFYLGEAARAVLLGDQEKAAGHSAAALLISRELYAGARRPELHRAELAAALAGHARYQPPLAAVALLTESAGHYAVLADGEPHRCEVERIDVLVRVALTVEASGNTRDAIRLLRKVITMYRQVPGTDPVASAAGLARACFHLGRCLLTAGDAVEALAYTDEGLRQANAVLRALQRGSRQSSAAVTAPDRRSARGHANGITRGINGVGPRAASPCGRADDRDPGWLSRAPRQVQLLAPDWVTAAARAMTMHAAAGRWPAAATAACAAVRVSGALAAVGGEERRDAHVAILGRARGIWARAGASGVPQAQHAMGKHPVRHLPLPASTAAGA